MGELLYSLLPSTAFTKNSLGKDGLQITVKKTWVSQNLITGVTSSLKKQKNNKKQEVWLRIHCEDWETALQLWKAQKASQV